MRDEKAVNIPRDALVDTDLHGWTRRNYCSHAVAGLRKLAGLYRDLGMLRDAGRLERIAELLHGAVKFALPDGGELFADGLRALPTVFHLPYKTIAIEFTVGEAPLVGDAFAESLRSHDLGAAPKRIALAVELAEVDLMEFTGKALGHSFSDGGIALISISHDAQTDLWCPSVFGLVVPCRRENEADVPGVLAATAAMMGGAVPKGFATCDVIPTYFEVMPDVARQDPAWPTVNWPLVWLENSHELFAVLGLVEILSCINVRETKAPAPALLNRKRAKRGQPPLYEMRVLCIDGAHSGPGLPPAGNHASPRMHLRRGHIRRLPGKSVWVNAHVVGRGDRGLVAKSYSAPSKAANRGSDQ